MFLYANRGSGAASCSKPLYNIHTTNAAPYTHSDLKEKSVKPSSDGVPRIAEKPRPTSEVKSDAAYNSDCASKDGRHAAPSLPADISGTVSDGGERPASYS